MITCPRGQNAPHRWPFKGWIGDITPSRRVPQMHYVNTKEWTPATSGLAPPRFTYVGHIPKASPLSWHRFLVGEDKEGDKRDEGGGGRGGEKVTAKQSSRTSCRLHACRFMNQHMVRHCTRHQQHGEEEDDNKHVSIPTSIKATGSDTERTTYGGLRHTRTSTSTIRCDILKPRGH